MREDASLFKYELAFTIIIKNGAPYMKEWIDFHRLAGVDHFYFYDNESSDNLKEVLQPYIDSGVVEYEMCPGKRPQCEAYNRAVKAHRFDCRYMGFVDDDEFVYCVDQKQTIKDVLHNVLDGRNDAVTLTVDRANFGSSGHEKADYSVGVLDRFQHRSNKLHTFGKNIVNPRMINYIDNPHYMNYFDGKIAVNPNGQINATIDPVNQCLIQTPPVADKIVMNHYYTKSREEFLKTISRGDVYHLNVQRGESTFDAVNKDHNDVFDDEIVKYRDARRALLPNGGGMESPPVMYNRLFNSMMQKLLPGMSSGSPLNHFAGKLHEYLTCRHVARFLNGKLLDADSSNFFEEISLKCAIRALASGTVEVWQLQLLFSELPNLLPLKYKSVGEIKKVCIQLIPQLKQQYRMQNNWRRYNQYDYLLNMLKGSD